MPYALDLDTIRAGIGKAPSCAKAAAIGRDCGFGSSGDVQLGEAVSQICEKDFLKGLSPSARKSYNRQRAACTAKYAHESGSMYRSFEAFCQSAVSERFSKAAKR